MTEMAVRLQIEQYTCGNVEGEVVVISFFGG